MLKSPLTNWLSVAIFALITIGYGVYRYRNSKIDRLYAEATAFPSESVGQSQAAVSRLSSYGGQRTSEMLLNIALGRTPAPDPETQRVAIEALTDRKVPRVSEAVAILLQPYQALPVRKSAALTLQKIPCDGYCIDSILHYLERISSGEPTYEQRSKIPVEVRESVASNLRQEEATVSEALYSVLRREAFSTVVSLRQIYGLGTDAPSTFALSLVSLMRLREACPAVLESERLSRQSSAEFFDAPREELESTLDAVKCR